MLLSTVTQNQKDSMKKLLKTNRDSSKMLDSFTSLFSSPHYQGIYYRLKSNTMVEGIMLTEAVGGTGRGRTGVNKII